VIALAVGISIGMGLGDNTRSLLITRGLAEIARLGAALGADQLTLAGLAGMGDLVATCSSPLSRNRTFGENLGRGMKLADAAAERVAGDRGREIGRAGTGTRPRPRRGNADHRGRRRGHPGPDGGSRGRYAAGLALGQAGALRSLTQPPTSHPRGERH
jgi:hypothetical protein